MGEEGNGQCAIDWRARGGVGACRMRPLRVGADTNEAQIWAKNGSPDRRKVDAVRLGQRI